MGLKKAAFVAATMLVAGWSMAAGAASADPPSPAPTPPAPAAPKTTIDTDGTFKVGTDIAPGTYASAGPVDGRTCYWKRMSDAASDNVIDNALSKKPQIVQIDATDASFKTD